MANVLVEGIYMGAEVKTSTYDGNTKSALYIDIYQPNADSSDKTVQLKTDDVQLVNTINDKYKMGSPFVARARVNAYKNKAYFRMLELA